MTWEARLTLVCETVMARTMAELVARRDRSIADIVELRLDSVAAPDVAAALAGRPRPVIVTCRAAWEGGAFRGAERDRLDLLRQAISLGAEYVDLEGAADWSALPLAASTRLIASFHDFEGVPRDLSERLRRLRAKAKNGIVKVAVTPGSPADCDALRGAVAGDGGDHVAIAMGAAGTITRTCPWLFESIWTYGGDAAPGQIDVTTLIGRYRVRDTGRGTRVFALTGAPLDHSASPAMFNAAWAAVGIDAVYVPIAARTAGEFLRAANAFGIEGASVTAPLKRGWESLGVSVDPIAARVGAVNTLKRTTFGWEARNFDVAGFLAPLESRRVELRAARAVVLGAGGAARAAAHALSSVGARVLISARRQDQARVLAAEIAGDAVAWPPPPDWDLLVNATPAGTAPQFDETPIAWSTSPPRGRGAIVYDLVYNPRETRLICDAKGAGLETIGGLEMLIAQAEMQFEYWLGRPAPAGVMARAAAAFVDGDGVDGDCVDGDGSPETRPPERGRVSGDPSPKGPGDRS